jgi:hypothetical protein
MVDHGDTSKELRHRVILVQAKALVQCSTNHSIAVECVTARVHVWSCASPPKEEGVLHFYISRIEPYSGTFILLDRERKREGRGRERDLLPGLSWWVLRRVMCSRTPSMASSVTLAPIASPSLTSL